MWLLDELEKTKCYAETLDNKKGRTGPPNPRPKGVIQGQTTRAVHDFLFASNAWHTFGQIQHATKCTRPAIVWALIRLRSWGKIETKPDYSRNPRFLKYRFIKNG